MHTILLINIMTEIIYTDTPVVLTCEYTKVGGRKKKYVCLKNWCATKQATVNEMVN